MLTKARDASVEAEQSSRGSAGVAGDGFCVEAAIGRIVIFRAARLAHGVARHRRLGAIKGNGFDNAQARPAMRAVGERIAEAAFGRIRDFIGAGDADRSVRDNLRVRGAPNTLGNAKLMWQVPAKGLCFDTVDPPERWWLALHAVDKSGDRSLAAADAHENSFRVVQDFARKAEITRNAPDGRPKPHSLHPAAHSNFHRD